MIIANAPSKFNIHDVYYCKPIRNKIMSGGMFIRLIYSNELVSINGIHVSFPLYGRIQEIYNNKFKYTHIGTGVDSMISSINAIEHAILENANIVNKNPQYKLHEQLQSGCFKYFQDNISPCKSGKQNNTYPPSITNFVLKISGIWTTDADYGITYKFTKVS